MKNRKFIHRWGWVMAVVLTAALICPAGLMAQAPKALVDVAGSPQAKDPHPTTYIWDGEIESIKEPQAIQYYTYFYTGIVNPNATVPLGESIQRIAVSLTDWETQKEAIITRLASFYDQSNAGGGAAAAKKQVVFDENFNYVETGGEEKKPGGFDPRAAAEWTFYYDQFVLWQFYCRRVLLNDREAVEASSSRGDLQMASDLQALQGIEGVDVNAVLSAAQEIRAQESGDIQQPPGKGGAAPKAKAPARGGSSAPKQEKLELTVATEFDPEADYADPRGNLVFREEFVMLAAEKEKKSVRVFSEMLTRVDERAGEMQRYNEWLAERHSDLVEFTEAWGNVKSGETVYMEDTFYLLTKAPVDQTPRDALNIVVRDAITPQDILDSSGNLKKPLDD